MIAAVDDLDSLYTLAYWLALFVFVTILSVTLKLATIGSRCDRCEPVIVVDPLTHSLHRPFIHLMTISKQTDRTTFADARSVNVCAFPGNHERTVREY